MIPLSPAQLSLPFSSSILLNNFSPLISVSMNLSSCVGFSFFNYALSTVSASGLIAEIHWVHSRAGYEGNHGVVAGAFEVGNKG
jgi:hypothetical protein